MTLTKANIVEAVAEQIGYTKNQSFENIRLPVNGVVCGSCGLVQGGNRKSCLYCGGGINTAVH
jgi:hypothetical protein